jgi:hypothetical protein
MTMLSESERRREFHKRIENKLGHLHGQYGIDAVVRRDYVPEDGRGYADVAWLARRPLSLLCDGREVALAAFRIVPDRDRESIEGAVRDLDAVRPAVAWLVLPDDAARDVSRSVEDRAGRIVVRTEGELNTMLGGSGQA